MKPNALSADHIVVNKTLTIQRFHTKVWKMSFINAST